jgi:hypothetical protein
MTGSTIAGLMIVGSTMQWREAPDAVVVPARLGSRTVALVAPVVVVALLSAVLAVRGEWWKVLLAVGILAVVVQVWIVAPELERRITDGLGKVGHAVGTAVGFVCLAVVFAAVSLGAAITRLLHRDAEAGSWGALGPSGPSDSAWEGATPTAAAHGGGTAGARRGSRLVRVAGVIAVAVVVDCLLGAILTGSGLLPPADRGDIRTSVLQGTDTTMSARPIVGEPWAEQYASELADFELGGEGVEPFLFTGFRRYRSAYINVTDEERVSYRPPVPSGTKPLQVAFFGGSVMFGVGQRDDHTIPSEFARIAAEHGVPVEVHNYGRPAWVSWQEQLYLERMLARGHHYDLVIFLDGFNEFEVQASLYSRDPTHIGADWLRALVDEFRDQRQSKPGYLDGLGDLADAYHDNSGVWRLVDALTGRRQLLAGAAPAAHGTPAEQADAALEIYQRSVDQIDGLAQHHDTPVRYFWQPQAAGWNSSVLNRLPTGTTSLASVFDGRQQDLYIDHVHTTEEGARILAQALWGQVEGELRGLGG